jgi:release factor glutamine methyltransferase
MTTPPTKIADVLQTLKTQLRDVAPDDLGYEARLILKEAAGIDAATVIAEPDKVLNTEQMVAIKAVATRRALGEPLSRILGWREFYGLRFILNADTLDPRPETELMIDGAREWLDMNPTKSTMLDLGTGTGCIPISLLKHNPNLRAVAVDHAAGALQAAIINGEQNGVAGRLQVMQSNWADAVTGFFDLICSNPPYIPSRDILQLDSNVTNHDPILALDGGEDGFLAHRAVLIAIKKHLSKGGLALVEIGQGQLAEFRRLVEEYGLDLDRVYMDYNGIPRVVGVCHTL